MRHRRADYPFARLAILAGALLAGCDQQGAGNEQVNSGNVAQEPLVNVSSVPITAGPIERSELLQAIAAAASATASGRADGEAQRALDGRQFELRVRFGCAGPSDDLKSEALGWSFDREKRTLRVRAALTISGDHPLVAELAGDQFESVEGFWIPRPWMFDPACPPTAAVRPTAAEADAVAAKPPRGQTAEAATAAPEPPPETISPKVGIAQFFTETDSRTGRRSARPYEAVVTLAAAQTVGSQGFDLVLSGRLRALPDKRVIACTSSAPNRAPDCLVSAQFDRVRIEWPQSREIVAEWGGG
jgi:hypothetical protein